jgi:hypothetical protein
VFGLSPGAEEVLNAAHKCEFHDLWGEYGFLPYLGVEASIRLTLLLHLCQDNPAEQIPETTVTGAVKITRWVVTENHRVVNESKNEGVVEKRRTDCRVMLQKIQDKGTITQRDLFRTYDVQKQTILKPILEELIQSGDVIKDADGRLRSCGESDKAPKFSIGAVANCRTASTVATNGKS